MGAPGWRGRSGASFQGMLQHLSCLKPSAEVVTILDKWVLKDVGAEVSLSWRRGKNIGLGELYGDSQRNKSFSS